MSPARPSSIERIVILEQKMSRIKTDHARMATKVDEMHAILLQAKGVRWAVIALSGLVGFVTGISQWLISKA